MSNIDNEEAAIMGGRRTSTMSENDTSEAATPKPAWRMMPWSALTTEQRDEWIEHVRKGELGRFTAGELRRYRDLAEEHTDLAHELDRTHRQIDELKQEVEELDPMVIEAKRELTEYQNEIEANASRRAIAEREAAQP